MNSVRFYNALVYPIFFYISHIETINHLFSQIIYQSYNPILEVFAIVFIISDKLKDLGLFIVKKRILVRTN